MRVQIEEISKTFGRVRANDRITMTLEGGRIYAILGENGAGKSTLMKILSGYQPPDSGRILVDGKEIAFNTPSDALACGIGMLHQDPLDVPVLTALDNFILGRPIGLIPPRAEMKKSFIETTQKMGFDLRPDAFVDTMTIGERQQLEIVRLISQGAKVLILDEPTTGISAEQKEALFGSLTSLAREQGMTVILVSHKLEDVAALCNEVVILRAGRVVGGRRMPTPISELVALMFGQVIERTQRTSFRRPEISMRIESIAFKDRRLQVSELSLQVHAGEVIGLAGLDGSGQRAFLRTCAGLQPQTKGRIMLGDKDITHASYHQRVHDGVAYAPAGRLEEGLIAGLSIAEHFALAKSSGWWVNRKAANQQAEASIARYNIRGRPESPIQTLSGGNQQRTLIGLLPENLKVMLLEDPTRGLDVESTRWVWQQLLARRETGAAIVFLSPDLDEIVEYSDRVLVFFGGRATLVEDLDHPPAENAERLGHLIGGGKL